MVPRLSNGASFLGAGRYYLHDKAAEGSNEKPRTAERVAWTETRNTLHTEAEAALVEMWHTAEAQQVLKQMAGRATSGGACAEPVKTIALAWHPEQRPDRDAMLQAAASYLEHMGWAEHQAVIVAHNDTAHAHLHIILNKVHPDTGLTLDEWRERSRSQAWAYAYEMEHGQLLCPAREAIYGRGEERKRPGHHIPHGIEKGGQRVEAGYLARLAADEIALRGEVAQQIAGAAHVMTLKRDHGADRSAGNEHQAALDAAPQPERGAAISVTLPAQDSLLEPMEQLKARHVQEREAFFAEARTEFRQVRRAAHHAVAEAMHEAWADHYAHHRGDDGHARDLRATQRQMTTELQQGACEMLYDARNAAYQELKQRQGEERHAMRALLDPETQITRDSDAIRHLIDTRHPAIDCASPILEALRDGAGDLQALIDAQHTSHESLLESLGVDMAEIEAHLDAKGDAPDKKRGRDGLDLAAGGIGAALSAMADALGSIISPPSPHEQLVAELIALHRAETEPEREAERHAREEERRVARQTTQHEREAAAEKERGRRDARPDWREEERRR